MSDFFEVPAPPAEILDHKRFPWAGPPENQLGVVVPLQIALVRTDVLSLTIPAVVVYSKGFELGFVLRRREPLGQDRSRDHPPALSFHSGTERDLRFALQFSDGTKATTTRRIPIGSEPSPPLLMSTGTRSSRRSDEGKLWAWPLPPLGPLTFVWEWRAEGIPLTRHETDSQPVLDAAARTDELWPDDRPLPTGPWTHVVGP